VGPRRIEFGIGNFEYKRHFGNAQRVMLGILLFRRTLRNRGMIVAHSCLPTCGQDKARWDAQAGLRRDRGRAPKGSPRVFDTSRPRGNKMVSGRIEKGGKGGRTCKAGLLRQFSRRFPPADAPPFKPAWILSAAASLWTA